MVSKNGEAQQCANTNRASMSVTLRETNMNIVAKSEFNFQGKALVPVSNITGVWFTSVDLAKALKYSNSRSVTMLYNKYADEFTSGMSQVLEVSTSGNYRKKVRVFSLRGAHLIAMFARSDVAKEFRRWVLDILDREVSTSPEASPMSRYLAKVIVRDTMFWADIEFIGKADSLNKLATGICKTLGYSPTGFTEVEIDAARIKRVH